MSGFDFKFSPDIRAVIFKELSVEVDKMLREMDLVPVGDKSQWLALKAQEVVVPYVKAGANAAIMTFWVGMIMGSKLRKKQTVENLEIDLHGQRFG